jgi:hypothetical protein
MGNQLAKWGWAAVLKPTLQTENFYQFFTNILIILHFFSFISLTYSSISIGAKFAAFCFPNQI